MYADTIAVLFMAVEILVANTHRKNLAISATGKEPMDHVTKVLAVVENCRG
jgi:hypothetical protein